MPATVNERAALRTTLFRRNGPTIPLLANARTLARMIATIFGTNDSGVFYDPLDLKTTYQGSTGTSSVSASAQPVGLMLDKSKGLELGTELVTAATPFTVFRDATTNIPSPSLAALQANTAYIVSITVSSVRGTTGADFRIKSASSNLVATMVFGTTIGTFSCILIPKITELLTVVGTSAGADFTVSSVSVKELKGNHAYQTTSAARPLFKQIEILGDELATNGSLTSDLSEWTAAASTYVDPIKGAVRDISTAISYPTVISRTFDIKEGAAYRITAEIFGSQTSPAKVLARKVSYNTITDQTTSVAISSSTPTKVSFTTVGTSTQKLYLSVVVDATNAIGSFGVRNISVKEITGYRTDRNFIEYDGVDDKLLTTFAAPLTNCTVVRAVPNEGTKILYNQTLPASYEDTLNHSGFFAINRALSNSEKVLLLNEMDKRTGITSLDSQVARSFANNEVGVAFNDFNDLSVLYQDAAGTVPVTAAGQPVGLVLDKSKGLVLSDELTTNGNFSQGLAGHLAVKGTQQLVAGKLQFTSTPNNDSSRTEYTFTGLTVGRWYEVAITARCVTTPTGNELIRSSDGFVVSTTAAPMVLSATMKVYTYRLLASATSGVLRVYAASGLNASSATIEIEKYSIRELAGNHAYQTVSASRPLLQATPILGTELWNKLSLSTVGESSVISQDIYRIYSATGNYSAVTSSASNLTTGKTYEVTVNVDSITTLGSGIALEGFNDKSINSVGKYKFTLVATNTKFNVKRAGLACDIQVSGVSVKEITGYHTDKNYLAFDGIDDFLQTNNIDFTSTDKVSVFAGVRKLNDSSQGMIAELSGGNWVGSFMLHCGGGNGSEAYTFGSRGSATGYSYSLLTKSAYPVLAAPKSNVITSEGVISTDVSKIKVDHTYSSSNPSIDQGTGNYGNYPLFIGRRGGVTYPFNGNLYSLIIMGRLASDAETTTLENAIAKQVGVTL